MAQYQLYFVVSHFELSNDVPYTHTHEHIIIDDFTCLNSCHIEITGEWVQLDGKRSYNCKYSRHEVS